MLWCMFRCVPHTFFMSAGCFSWHSSFHPDICGCKKTSRTIQRHQPCPLPLHLTWSVVWSIGIRCAQILLHSVCHWRHGLEACHTLDEIPLSIILSMPHVDAHPLRFSSACGHIISDAMDPSEESLFIGVMMRQQRGVRPSACADGIESS